jgi:glutamate-1-semialdehyde 2,1-aminomutase
MHELIPGGAHTYSKGDDQFPTLAPGGISHGKGAYLTDLDGNIYLDVTMGLASISLGHAYDEIIEAVKEELDKGVNFQRPSYIELEIAKAFLDLIPVHQMIKFAKNGSTATTAAVKLARAKTKRKYVAFPGDHPFYSYDDWFIGKTNCTAGVPEEIQALSITFKACDIASLEALFKKYPNEIACVITEPEKNQCSASCSCNGRPDIFLKAAIELCHKHGALFILDEMQTGFRTHFPGSISRYGIKPDMATWGKGIANGFSFCALTGTREVMDLGAINIPGQEKVFLISTTHGAETHSIRAALKTIEIFKKQNVIGHNHNIGKMVIEKITALIKSKKMESFVEVIPCQWYPAFVFKNKEGVTDLSFKTLMMQEMIKRGVLFQGFFLPCFSHTDKDVEFFEKVFSESLDVYNKALDKGIQHYLVGEPIKPVFRKHN